MELDFSGLLMENFELAVFVASLLIGYALKHGSMFKRIPNNDIPLILLVFGAVLNGFVSGWEISNVVFGGFMGLASTGSHQAFKQFITKDKE